MSCERQLDDALRALAGPADTKASVDMKAAAIQDACSCIAELYRVPSVYHVPKDNLPLHALLARMQAMMPTRT